jgi:Protein of unknown function/AsmA-like C-terminal region
VKIGSHILHYVGVAFCAVLGCAVLALIGIIVWLGTAPREVPYAKDMLRSKLIRQKVIVDAQMHSVTAYLNIRNAEMEMQIEDLSTILPGGDVQVKTIRLSSPLKYVFRRKVGFDVLLFDDIHINVKNHPDIAIPSLYIQPDAGNIKQTRLNVDLSQVQAGATLNGLLEIHDEHISIDMKNQNIPLSLLALLGNDYAGINAVMSGTFYVSFGKDGVARYAKAQQHTDGVTYTNPTLYPNAPLHIDTLTIAGDWKHKHNEVALSEFIITRADAAIKGSAFFNEATQSLDATISNFAVNDIAIIAPKMQQEVEALTWVTTHLFDGIIEKGTVAVTQQQGQEANVKAVFEAKKLRAEPSPQIPSITGIKGIATVTADSLHVDIAKAKTLENTKLKKGTLEVKSFSEGAAPLNLTLNLATTAQDVATFLLPKYLNKAEKLNLQPNLVKGNVTGDIVLSFPLYPDRVGLSNSSFDHVDIDVKANLTEVSHPSLLGDLPIKDMAGTLALNNDKVSVDAKGVLKNAPITIKASHVYGGGKADTHYEADVEIADGKLKEFDVPIPQKYVNGTTLLHAVVDEDETKQDIKATLDFSKAALDVDIINWHKPKGIPATLKVHQYISGKTNEIKSFDFASASAEAKGSLLLNKAGVLRSASMKTLKFYDNVMSMDYKEGDIPNITINATRFYAPEDDTPTNEPAKEQPFDFLLAKNIKAHFDTFYYKGVAFNNLALESQCSSTFCSSLSLKAFHNKDKEIHATIAADEKGRALRIKIQEAGAMLSDLDIMDYMQRGNVSFKGYYKDTESDRPIEGNITIKDMKIVGAPFLTKIFTLGSLSGLGDTLAGNGIAFEKTKAGITYNNGNIMISKLSAKGDAMGVIVDGTMSLNAPEKIDIDGTIIPSYALNSLPGKVPIIGEILVGGEDEGMFGTRFSAKGALHEPSITANPLSMLTPGFLRNIFDIFPDSTPKPPTS